jgi:hypothetical protein
VTRRTGEITPRQVDRDYPHQVEIAIPEGGLGTRLSAMDEFCRGADFRTCGMGAKRLRTGRDGVRFCFKTPDMAEAFRPGLGEIYQPVAGGMNASNDE